MTPAGVAIRTPMRELECMETDPQQRYLKILNDSIRMDPATLVTELLGLLGAALVAYLASVDNTRVTRMWAEGVIVPGEIVLQRLRLAYRIARLVGDHDAPGVAAAWMSGLNPALYDRGPATMIREGDPAQVGPAVLSAAEDFLARG